MKIEFEVIFYVMEDRGLSAKDCRYRRRWKVGCEKGDSRSKFAFMIIYHFYLASNQIHPVDKRIK